MANSWWQDNSDQDSNSWWDQPGFFDNVNTQTQQPHESFFGHLKDDVVGAVKAPISFFGDVGKSIYNDAKTTVKTGKDITEAIVGQHQANADIATDTAAMKNLSDQYHAGKITLDQLNKGYKLFQARGAQRSKDLAGEGINKDSGLKSGAAAASTFLNLVPGVDEAKVLLTGGGKEIAKTAAEQGFKAAAKKTARVLATPSIGDAERQAALADAVQQGGAPAARAAIGHFADQAGGNALFGAAQSGLQATADGQSTGDAWHDALLGGAIGGALGGAGTLLDRNVRAGLREVPGQVSQGADNLATMFANRPALAANESGHYTPFFPSPDSIDRPGNTVPSPDSGNPDVQSPQLSRNPEQDSQQAIINDVAAHYSSPEQYLSETAKAAYNFDKGLRGGDLQSDGAGNYTRGSEHTKFYRDFYAATGHAPSQQAFRDQIEHALETGGDGGGIIDPAEADIYKLVKENTGDTQSLLSDPAAAHEAVVQQHLAALNGEGDLPTGPAATADRTRVPAGLPARPAAGQVDINGQPLAATAPANGKIPAGLPKGPQRGQEALPGQRAEEQPLDNNFYHGTGTAGLTADTVDASATRPDGLFGSGVYTTNDPEIAQQYAKVRSNGGKGYVYNVKLNPKKTLDLEAPVPDDAQPAFRDLARIIDEGNGDNSLEQEVSSMLDRKANGEEIYKSIDDAIRDAAAEGDMRPAAFAQDFSSKLTDAGYDTLTHTGGKLTGGRQHKVVIALDPRNTNASNLENPITSMEINRPNTAPVNDLMDLINSDLKEAPGKQEKLATENPDPYANFEQNLNRPALGPGKTELTPKEAKEQFRKTGNAPEVKNTLPSGEEAIPLHATAEETNRAAVVHETPSGKVKVLDKNPARAGKDVQEAIQHIAQDDTGSRFTTTRTPELNLEEATAPRGGVKSKDFRALDELPKSIRQHTAEYTQFVDKQKSFMNKFVKTYKWGAKESLAARQYLEAETPEARATAGTEFRKEFGDDAARGLEPLRTHWDDLKMNLRNDANEQIVKYAGEKRAIGDLGENYLTRVYKRPGIKGLRATAIDLAHSGLDAIGGKGKGSLFDLENPDGYLSKESDAAGGVLRGSEGIPINSEHAKPNTMFLSSAQHRTAEDPQGELQGALESMMAYSQAVGKAKYFTQDIAKGRSIQKVIAGVHEESGNLRQMHQSYDDMLNSLSGKTSRFDRYFTDTKTGNAVINAASKIQRNIGRSTILGSANSAIAQTGQLPLVLAENGAGNFKRGMQDMFHFLGKKNSEDDPISESSLLRTRYPDNEDPFQVSKVGRASNKATDVIAKPFRIIEKAATQFAWRSSYSKALADGFEGKAAIHEADRIAAKIIGERSPGARAALYESKALGPVSAYTLEVNQMYQVAKQYFKRDPKKAAALVGAIWLYNQGYQAMTGNKLNADPLAATLDAGSILRKGTDANGAPISVGERLARATGRIAGEAVDATPLGDTVAAQLYPESGFHVPFGGGTRMLSRADVFGNTNLGRYGGGTPIASGLSNPLLALGIPGAAQFQKSVEGIKALNSGASTTASGQTRFTIDPTSENYLRALLFGQYGTSEGRAYLAGKNANLSGS